MLVFAWLCFSGLLSGTFLPLLSSTCFDSNREIDSLIRFVVCLFLLILGDAVVANGRGASEGYWGMLTSPMDGGHLRDTGGCCRRQ